MAKLKLRHPISGSRFFRGYCERCGDPMRVESLFIEVKYYCRACGGGKHIGCSSPSSRIDYDNSGIAYSGMSDATNISDLLIDG